MVTQDDITVVYNELVSHMKEAYKVGERLIDARTELEVAKLMGLRDGSIDGKNEALREAAAREALPDLYEDVKLTEEEDRKAQHELAVAKAYVEMVRAQLRLQVQESVA